MLVLVDNCGLGDGVGLGRLGMVDLNVLAPFVGLEVPGDAHAARTLERNRCRNGTWPEKATKTDGAECVIGHLATWNN